MSWENVDSISNIKIWSEYSDSTQAHLFVNGRHQVLLTVGISFTLINATQPGPDSDEVLSVLQLINNTDSGSLKYLTEVDKGQYNSVFDPSLQSSSGSGASVDNGIYDYTYSFYLQSDRSINVGGWSESVALRLDYISYRNKSPQTVVYETSRLGSGLKTNVQICCYPERLYGNPGGRRTPLNIIERLSSVPVHLNHNQSSGSGFHSDLYALYIDDDYFKIIAFDGQHAANSTALEPLSYYMIKEKTRYDKIQNTHFPSVSPGKSSYNVEINFREGAGSGTPMIEATVSVDQQEGDISFIASYYDLKGDDSGQNHTGSVLIYFYDQFGNSGAALVNECPPEIVNIS